MAAQSVITELSSEPVTAFKIKLAIDSLRKTTVVSKIQEKISDALLAKGLSRLKNGESQLAICYMSVCLRELSNLSRQGLSSGTAQTLAPLANFGQLRTSKSLGHDLTLAALGLGTMSYEYRAIVNDCVKMYPDEPFFLACAVEEYTGGYRNAEDKEFKPGWGPNWKYVETACTEAIKRWPNYPTFWLYRGLAFRRKSDSALAVKDLTRYRDLIRAKGGNRLKNMDTLIEELKKAVKV